jgi:prepilin peptidase CpaA
MLALLAVAAAVWDLRTRRIPNWLTLPGIAVGIAANVYLAGWAGLRQSMEGFAAGFAVYFVLYLIRAMGAGDVKLMAAVGAFAGPVAWFYIFVFTAIAGGAIALVMVAWTGRFRRTMGNVGFILMELMHFRAPYLTREELSVKSAKSLRLPQGVAIGVGCLVFLARPYFGRIH